MPIVTTNITFTYLRCKFKQNSAYMKYNKKEISFLFTILCVCSVPLMLMPHL